MHPYIPHLLADIAAAHRTDIPHQEEADYILKTFHLQAISPI